ncbi:MAG TPA: hypothetical protein VG273_03010 [Bryobacteraceae bacterium]|jgi:hypothetical protein|nr:hypothetical protein [Bryobacteraceae bacterium]
MEQNGASKWREVADKHHFAMIDELTGQFHSDVQDAVMEALSAERAQLKRQVARACDDARRSHAELLNQALRRQRQAPDQEQALRFLLESAGPFADKAVVLVFENNQAHVVAAKGLEKSPEAMFPVAEARAVVAAIETRDPVVALASPEELSGSLAAAFRGEAGEDGGETPKAYLFPLVARQSVTAVLIASGAVDQAPVELLCGAAAMRLEALMPRALSHSATAAASPSSKVHSAPASSWNDLSPEEQKIHLQAQRMARVRVAEIRLNQEEALRDGTVAKDIYSALRDPIEGARKQFLQTYLSKSPTMVDYLHLEILRGLAGDDDQLLGAGYPGPMV